MSALRNLIVHGDALTKLRNLPAESVDCVVTSPPYFRLRDYDRPGQLGLETTVDGWVDALREVSSELARVLVSTGTFWLNLGDSYSTHGREGMPRKSLLLAPERLLLALSDDGWIVRNKIIWAKTNTIPSSVRDRLSTTHEFIYLLSRSPAYYFDLDSVRVPHTSRAPKPRANKESSKPVARPSWLGPNADDDRGLDAVHASGRVGHPLGKNPGDVWSMSVSRYRGAHFATYPEHLVERMIQAGCPELRCGACKSAWRRPVRRLGALAVREALAPTCVCPNARGHPEPGLVLDPFIGSGTTGVVAERLQRDWLGIELNDEYIRLAHERIRAGRASTSDQAREEAA
jgi:site-specific DNA-methyltransferase (adenine-specific)